MEAVLKAYFSRYSRLLRRVLGFFDHFLRFWRLASVARPEFPAWRRMKGQTP
jgi:hypothetical protein